MIATPSYLSSSTKEKSQMAIYVEILNGLPPLLNIAVKICNFAVCLYGFTILTNRFDSMILISIDLN